MTVDQQTMTTWKQTIRILYISLYKLTTVT